MMDITLQGGAQFNIPSTPTRAAYSPNIQIPHCDSRGMYWSEMHLNGQNNTSGNQFSSVANLSANRSNVTLGHQSFDRGLETSFDLIGSEQRTASKTMTPSMLPLEPPAGMWF